jgi:DNA-binding beta-propeller fold protein YncE
MTDLECKFIDAQRPISTIATRYGKFLIIVEATKIFRYDLETGHKNEITQNKYIFNNPKGLTFSKDFKTLFVVDSVNGIIYAICVQTGETTILAKLSCQHSESLQLSPDGKTLYLVDCDKLITICIATGQVDKIQKFENYIHDITLSPDGKHIYVSYFDRVLKFNIETCKVELVFDESASVNNNNNFNSLHLSNNDHLLFVSNHEGSVINIINISSNDQIDQIKCFEPCNITCSDGKLYICNYNDNFIYIIDISKYCTNFKTFTQLQLSKYSFLPRQVIEIIN